jgi:hypothetical protein
MQAPIGLEQGVAADETVRGRGLSVALTVRAALPTKRVSRCDFCAIHAIAVFRSSAVTLLARGRDTPVAEVTPVGVPSELCLSTYQASHRPVDSQHGRAAVAGEY